MTLFSKTKYLTVTRQPGSCNTPFINISGLWLKAEGFNPGDVVKVEYSTEQILITRTTHQWATEDQKVVKRFLTDENGHPLKYRGIASVQEKSAAPRTKRITNRKK